MTKQLSAKEWRALFDALEDPIFLHDSNYCLIHANQAYLKRAGMSESTALGLPYWNVFPKSSGPLPSCVRAMQGASEEDEEVAIATGEIFISRAFPVRNVDGNYLSSIHRMHDITQRKRLHEEALRNASRLHDALLATIEAVARVLEKRDPYTAGHQKRTAALCEAIGTELGLGPEQIEGLRLGALIHDIGKIYVPAEILNRPGKLTAAEFALIKSHPEIGHEIVKDTNFPWPVADMILQHHERLDGSGYPHGLKGEGIAFEARILAVADVVEAITSHRPYRAALGLDAAIVEIETHRGRYYDPQVVNACLRLIRDKGFKF